MTVKGCTGFAGVVKFFYSLFCPELQKLLNSIYDLTRKGRQFIWGEEQKQAFDEIKRLLKLPVLHLPDNKGRFHLHSDSSTFATGSASCQIQNGKPKLITYMRKRLPEAAQNHSITELEICGLTINIISFSHLLKKVDIIKSKVEPTTRIKRLLEVLSSYSFNLYYVKGKGMILSDFLSR